MRPATLRRTGNDEWLLLRPVYTSDRIRSGIRSRRSLMIVCKSKNGVSSGIASVTESESERSEGFLFPSTSLLLQLLTILCKLVKWNRKHIKRKRQPITELIPSP